MADTAIALRPDENLYQPPQAVPSLVPANLTEAIRLAELMAKSRLVPVHLQDKPADCFLVIEQSQRWGMSPFAVAQCASCIKGKLMFEGKLVAAVINAHGGLSKRLSFDYEGEGQNRKVVVSGTLRGEAGARVVDVVLKDAATDNKVWQTQPDQQLAYHGARVWARRHMPELMLGVYAPEEFDEPRPHVAAHPRSAAPRAEPPASEPASVTRSSEPPAWHQANPAKMKALQASIAGLNLGKAEADERGLKGAPRAEYIREVRLLYISRTVGREIASTLDLTEEEAGKVLDAANNGVFPTDERDLDSPGMQ